MSLEEDYLMREVAKLRARIETLEGVNGVKWGCRECGTRFAVGLEKCPNCQSADIVRDPADVEALPEGGRRAKRNAEPVDYSRMGVSQLQAELKSRQDAYAGADDEEGLEAVSFTKQDSKAVLIAKLVADDEATTEE